ncbi:hypothetical protein VIGAN_04103000 [Vigna angularis var. angularis]|uniref:Uncharacterized protein n=1 Tax=Vigna angularis var. angularis TaxID=157739 RepID=A0A0S3RTB1_PHAAN|nr:hypothetical protein VIGAN_04103000 [Vigna angularis var. angularis]
MKAYSLLDRGGCFPLCWNVKFLLLDCVQLRPSCWNTVSCLLSSLHLSSSPSFSSLVVAPNASSRDTSSLFLEQPRVSSTHFPCIRLLHFMKNRTLHFHITVCTLCWTLPSVDTSLLLLDQALFQLKHIFTLWAVTVNVELLLLFNK